MTNPKDVLEWMSRKEERERNMTNEEWFNGLSTETKARIMHLVYIAGYTDGFHGAETIPLRDINEWLKQPHEQRGETK